MFVSFELIKILNNIRFESISKLISFSEKPKFGTIKLSLIKISLLNKINLKLFKFFGI